LQILQSVLIFAVILFSAIAIAFLVAVTWKAMRTPNVYYAPTRKIEELANELMCPKCGLRHLKPVGRYTIRCETCGFTFNVGVLRLKGE